MQPLPIVQIKETCLYVTDLENTRAFYQDVLGLPLLSLVPGRHVFFRAGASVLLCFLSSATQNDVGLPPHYGYGQQHLAFEVTPQLYEDTKKSFLAKGITIEHEHTWPGGFTSFYFRDPDQHCLEIVQSGMWEVGK